MSRPVVFLHGFTGSPDGWAPVTARLKPPAGSRALPLLGHGPELVDGPERHFDDEIQRLSRLLEGGEAPVDLVGYSLGARTALGLLCRRPDLVRRALLIGVHPGLDDDAERRARVAADAVWIERLESEPFDAFLDAWQALPLFATQSRLEASVLQRQRQERRRHDPRGLARSLGVTGLGVMPSFWHVLPSLESRAHLVVGALDEKFRRLAERARDEAGLRVSVVADAGHNVPLERPEALAALVSEVLG